jgi:hypothetical protein
VNNLHQRLQSSPVACSVIHSICKASRALQESLRRVEDLESDQRYVTFDGPMQSGHQKSVPWTGIHRLGWHKRGPYISLSLDLNFTDSETSCRATVLQAWFCSCSPIIKPQRPRYLQTQRYGSWKSFHPASARDEPHTTKPHNPTAEYIAAEKPGPGRKEIRSGGFDSMQVIARKGVLERFAER